MKKTIALVLALICLLTFPVLAMATDATTGITPSRTISTATTITDSPVEVVTEARPEDTVVLAALNEFVTVENKPVATFFEEDVQTQIAAALPAGKDAATLQVNEYVPLKATQTVSGETRIKMSTAVKYTKQDALVVMYGVYNPNSTRPDKMDWVMVPYELDENGMLIVTLPPEVTETLADDSTPAALMVLSDREAVA